MAAAVQIVLISGAHAAGSVEPLKGDVLMKRGDKFVSLKAPARGGIGQTVIVKSGGKARVICSASKAYEMDGPGRFKIPADCKSAPAAKR